MGGMRVKLSIDGGVRGGNPGLAAIGFVVSTVDGELVGQGGFLLEGEHSSNEAEYAALIAGLFNAHHLGATSVDVFTDSQLVHGHLTGEFRVNQQHIADYIEEVQKEERKFTEVTYTWIRRSNNKEADKITRDLLDDAMAKRGEKDGD